MKFHSAALVFLLSLNHYDGVWGMPTTRRRNSQLGRTGASLPSASSINSPPSSGFPLSSTGAIGPSSSIEDEDKDVLGLYQQKPKRSKPSPDDNNDDDDDEDCDPLPKRLRVDEPYDDDTAIIAFKDSSVNVDISGKLQDCTDERLRQWFQNNVWEKEVSDELRTKLIRNGVPWDGRQRTWEINIASYKSLVKDKSNKRLKQKQHNKEWRVLNSIEYSINNNLASYDRLTSGRAIRFRSRAELKAIVDHFNEETGMSIDYCPMDAITEQPYAFEEGISHYVECLNDNPGQFDIPTAHTDKSLFLWHFNIKKDASNLSAGQRCLLTQHGVPFDRNSMTREKWLHEYTLKKTKNPTFVPHHKRDKSLNGHFDKLKHQSKDKAKPESNVGSAGAIAVIHKSRRELFLYVERCRDAGFDFGQNYFDDTFAKNMDHLLAFHDRFGHYSCGDHLDCEKLGEVDYLALHGSMRRKYWNYKINRVELKNTNVAMGQRIEQLKNIRFDFDIRAYGFIGYMNHHFEEHCQDACNQVGAVTIQDINEAKAKYKSSRKEVPGNWSVFHPKEEPVGAVNNPFRAQLRHVLGKHAMHHAAKVWGVKMNKARMGVGAEAGRFGCAIGKLREEEVQEYLNASEEEKLKKQDVTLDEYHKYTGMQHRKDVLRLLYKKGGMDENLVPMGRKKHIAFLMKDGLSVLGDKVDPRHKMVRLFRMRHRTRYNYYLKQYNGSRLGRKPGKKRSKELCGCDELSPEEVREILEILEYLYTKDTDLEKDHGFPCAKVHVLAKRLFEKRPDKFVTYADAYEKAMHLVFSFLNLMLLTWGKNLAKSNKLIYQYLVDLDEDKLQWYYVVKEPEESDYHYTLQNTVAIHHSYMDIKSSDEALYSYLYSEGAMLFEDWNSKFPLEKCIALDMGEARQFLRERIELVAELRRRDGAREGDLDEDPHIANYREHKQNLVSNGERKMIEDLDEASRPKERFGVGEEWAGYMNVVHEWEEQIDEDDKEYYEDDKEHYEEE